MSSSNADLDSTPNLNPEMYEPITNSDILSILDEPLGHEDELAQEGATTYNFDGQRDGEKWHNTSGRTKEEVRELSNANESAALIMSPCVHTNYIEFRLEAPDGPAKECNCNSCWSRFWIAPFSEPAECPFCHERGFNIASRRVISGE